jgi:hypothetical protein
MMPEPLWERLVLIAGCSFGALGLNFVVEVRAVEASNVNSGFAEG